MCACVCFCRSVTQHPLVWHTVSCQQSVCLMHIHRVHLCLMLSGYLSVCCSGSGQPVCMRNTRLGKCSMQERMGKDFWHLWHAWPCLQQSCGIYYLYLHQRVTLTVPLARLLLCQFLLCCDFQHCQAPAGIQLLWFVADDGTVLTRQLAASNHSNRKGGELSGSWAHSQVMSSLPLTTSPSSLSISQAGVQQTKCIIILLLVWSLLKPSLRTACFVCFVHLSAHFH